MYLRDISVEKFCIKLCQDWETIRVPRWLPPWNYYKLLFLIISFIKNILKFSFSHTKIIKHKHVWWSVSDLKYLPEYKNTFNPSGHFLPLITPNTFCPCLAWQHCTLNFRTEPCIKGVNGAKMFPWRVIFSAKASETFFTAICLFHHSLRTGQSLARCQLSKSNASHFSKIYPSSHANII